MKASDVLSTHSFCQVCLCSISIQELCRCSLLDLRCQRICQRVKAVSSLATLQLQKGIVGVCRPFTLELDLTSSSYTKTSVYKLLELLETVRIYFTVSSFHMY